MDMLRITGLRKRFGDKEVLKGLDLTVPEGSIFGFIGQNGAGKTTAMKTVLGLLKADGGEIYVNGERAVYGQTATNRFIGYLPDVPEFYGFMTSAEYLDFCGEISGMEKAETVARRKELLELVGLKDEKHRVGGFSRGMKQRLGIAQALLNSPKLLLCDEPTSALDPVGRKEILDILLAVRDRTTVLFSTHILSDVERICTDVAFLHGGSIRIQGSMEEIRSRFRTDGYRLETADEAHRTAVLQAFPAMKPAEGNVLTFTEQNTPVCDVLRFVADQRIPLLKWERIEPTLESVFMEVIEA